ADLSCSDTSSTRALIASIESSSRISAMAVPATPGYSLHGSGAGSNAFASHSPSAVHAMAKATTNSTHPRHPRTQRHRLERVKPVRGSSLMRQLSRVSRRISEPRVRVEALEEQVDDRVVEDDGADSDEGEPRARCAAPAAGCPRVDVAGVDHPDDEGPYFLGVPPPEAAPRPLRPNGAGDEGEGPQHEADDDGAVRERLESFGVRQAA